MSLPQSIRETLLWRKATELVENVRIFSERLPNSDMDIYGLNNKLKSSVSDIPNYIEDSYERNTKTGRGRTVFMADNSLNECKSYLNQVRRMNIAETEELIESVEQFRKILYGEQTFEYNQPA